MGEGESDSSDDEFFDAPSSFTEVDNTLEIPQCVSFHCTRNKWESEDRRKRGDNVVAEAVSVPRKYCEKREIGYGEGITETEGISLTRIAKELLMNVKAGADVTNIQLPACVLDPVSSLEKGLKAMQRGEILQDIAKAEDPLERMLQVLRFFLSGLSKETFGKKPYNPILGEVFRSCFKHRDDGGYTVMVAEQVSHHPPITALHLNNPTLGISMTSYNAPEPRFWGNSLEIKLNGTIDINVKRSAECYRITRPTLYMSGFIAGKQRLEFVGPVSIACPQSDYIVELDFKAKGLLGFRGEMHAIQGKLMKKSTKTTIFHIQGAWDKQVTVKNSSTNEKQLIFDYEATRDTHGMDCILPSRDEREQTNSLNVWRECTKALYAGDTVAAGDAKRRVEEAQRNARKEREAAGVEHSPRYFQKKHNEEGYEVKQEVHNQLHPPDADHSECCEGQDQSMLSGSTSMSAPSHAMENGIVNGYGLPPKAKKTRTKKRKEGPRLKRGLESLSLKARKKGITSS